MAAYTFMSHSHSIKACNFLVGNHSQLESTDLNKVSLIELALKFFCDFKSFWYDEFAVWNNNLQKKAQWNNQIASHLGKISLYIWCVE